MTITDHVVKQAVYGTVMMTMTDVSSFPFLSFGYIFNLFSAKVRV